MWNLTEYRFARSPAEAVTLLRAGPGRGMYIAGGTDLLLAPPAGCDFVVDITGAGLDEIARTPTGDLFIGATASLQKVVTSPLVAGHAGGAIAAAAHACGNRPVRSVGTVGGNLCHAVPSADMAPVLLALQAVARITDGQDQETVPLRDFFTGPRRTVLDGRLLIGIQVPGGSAGWLVASRKLTRVTEDISLVQVAVGIQCDGSVVEAATVALGAVGPTPLVVEEAAGTLLGCDLADPGAADRFAAAAAEARAAASPIDDHRASAAYRLEMVEVLCRRLLTELAQTKLRRQP